ncbi:MAG: rod shape-determining protein MreD, partial [Gammaproteobacteria bacterium]|nr:rod shape-determining protein MreD [Gammaproteobacteria bacterium]
AIALSIVAYLTLRFHLQIRIFPMWQLTMTVFALLAINAFIQFWIDGVAGVGAAGIGRWTQVMTGAILWPPLMALMDRVRVQIQTRGSAFI